MVRSTEDNPPRSVVGNWPLLVWFQGYGGSPGWQSWSRPSGRPLAVSLPACRGAWGWLYLPVPKDELHPPRREIGTAAP